MKMLKFQSTLYSKVRGQGVEYKSSLLYIPLVDEKRVVEREIAWRGCQKMIYPQCFEVNSGSVGEKCCCKCKCRK